MRTVSLLFVILIFNSCDNGISPPDPRGLHWSIEVLPSDDSQVGPNKVWGVSASEMYVVCHSSSVRTSKLYSNKGGSWHEIDVSQFGSSQIFFDLLTITGRGQNDIWAAGYRSYPDPSNISQDIHENLVLHFDGNAWQRVSTPTLEGSIFAGSIVAGGGYMFGGPGKKLLRSISNVFVNDSLGWYPYSPDSLSAGIFSMAGADLGGSYVLYRGYVYYSGLLLSQYYLYKLNGNQWDVLDTTGSLPVKRVWESRDGTLFGFGDGVFVWTGSGWTSVVNAPSNIGLVFGTTSDNVFGEGSGNIHHFNGKDWFSYPNVVPSGMLVTDGWTDGREVFVVGINDNQGYVLHGK